MTTRMPQQSAVGNRQSAIAPQSAASPRRTVMLVLTLALPVVAMVALPGCHFVVGGPRNFENENDHLRRENLELRQHTEQLEERLEAQTRELATLRRQFERVEAEPMPDAEPPRLSRLRLGRYSGGVDTTNDGLDDRIRVYLRPVDQHGRLIPVAGRAVIEAVAIPADGQPRVLARRAYDPRQFDRAWRSGFTGSHYTLELELPTDIHSAEFEDISELTVRVSFTEARTGVELHVQQSFSIRSS